MSDAHRQEIDETLRDLAELKKKRQPNRFHARELLVALGSLILESEEGAEPPEVARVRDATEPFEGWPKAVEEELSLACAEHILGVDPRFLKLPNFDFDYLVAARERLEARLRAVEALGLPTSEDLLNRVADADQRVEPFLESRRAAEDAG